MTEATLRRAVAEAARFSTAAKELLADKQALGDAEAGSGSRLSGYVRRASMDLSRALADYRASR